MRSIVLFTFLGLIPVSAKDAPLRALLVCGGCCHDYAAQAPILRDGIQARANVRVDVVRSEATGTKPIFPMYRNKDWAKGYDVVIHDECAADVKEMPYVRNIVENGVPAVNLHCAMHSYRTGTDIWFEYLGLQSSAHGAQRPIAIDFQGATHPITEGLKNWTTVGEELYNNVKVFATAKPLALGTQDGNTSVVAWTNDYHGTRIFSTTIGHNNETVKDDRYLDLVVRGLLWSCNKLSPAYLQPYSGPAGSFETLPADAGKVEPVAPKNATLVSVRASSVQGENVAANAVDGSMDTRWCAADPSFPQSLEIAFDGPRRVDAVKIDWESENNAYAHTIEGSLDGKTWKTLEDARGNRKPGGTMARFAAAPVKFLRIACTGTSQGGWASIREVLVRGEKVGPLFPKKGTGDFPATGESLKKSGNVVPEIRRLTPAQEAEILKDVKVADGFDVTLFANASAANYPVYVAAAPNGDLYVSSDGNGSLDRDAGRGRILRLRDSDGDGRADQVTEFVKDVDSPRGLVWDNDRLYLVHPPDISCYIDHDGDGVAEEEKTLIRGIAFGFKDRPADHTTNGLELGIDGWLYIAGGDFGFMDAVGTDGKHLQHRGGGVVRFRPDGSGLEIFADGTRNILATPMSPLLDLFARDNTNDGGGWDVRFHHFTGLEDHGYPRLYMNFKDEIVQPLADYGGGSGCGGVYISEPGIPEKWNDAPFTCDWGTGALWHHTVTPYGATFQETAKPEPLIRMTRPTDASIDGMSRLYQASWKGATFKWEGPDVGYIVRVTPRGYKAAPLPDFAKASGPELVKLLESPSQVRTLAAQRTLLRQADKLDAATNTAIFALAGNPAKPLPARVAALYSLTQRMTAGQPDGPLLEAVTALAADPQLQRFVLRAMADAGLPETAAGKTVAPVKPYAAGLKSDNPRTRLEAIIGATRQNMISLAPAIAAQLGDSDPVIAHTAFRGLARLHGSDACFAVLDNPEAPAEQVTGALRALMRMHSPEVVKGLIGRLANPARRAGVFGALARLYFHEGEWKGDSWGTRPDTRGPYYQPETWSESPAIAAALKATLDKAGPQEAPAMVTELTRNRVELQGALDSLAAAAKADPKSLPDVVRQLAGMESVPSEIAPLLGGALSAGFPPETTATAISLIVKTDVANAWAAIPDALARLAADKNAEKDFTRAKTAYLSAPKLENHHQAIESRAETADAGAVWADAALLALAGRQSGSPEARELSKKVLETGWAKPQRAVQILAAIRATDSHLFDDQVLAAAASPDAAVAAAAAETVKALKLAKDAADTTPLVSSMSQDQAIAAVAKERGDPSLGKQIFSRQGCVSCHATSMDQPQIGPYLGTIAQTYRRDDLALNILDPNKTIAQGFATEMFTLKDGTQAMGFVTLESATEVKARNIAGQEFVWKTDRIAKREKLPMSMMPPGLASPLTIHEFASLLDYIEALSKK